MEKHELLALIGDLVECALEHRDGDPIHEVEYAGDGDSGELMIVTGEDDPDEHQRWFISAGGVREVRDDITVTLRVSHGSLAPHEECEGMWTPYSFCQKHVNYTHPMNTQLLIRSDGTSELPSLKHKLLKGYAFLLSYFEHGEGLWSMMGEGPQCQFDSVNLAGVLIWEEDEANLGSDGAEGRREDAQHFLDVYNDWCNGHVYDIEVTRDDDMLLDNVYNVADCNLDAVLAETVHPHTEGKEINVEGDAAWLQEHHKLIPDAT